MDGSSLNSDKHLDWMEPYKKIFCWDGWWGGRSPLFWQYLCHSDRFKWKVTKRGDKTSSGHTDLEKLHRERRKASNTTNNRVFHVCLRCVCVCVSTQVYMCAYMCESLCVCGYVWTFVCMCCVSHECAIVYVHVCTQRPEENIGSFSIVPCLNALRLGLSLNQKF